MDTCLTLPLGLGGLHTYLDSVLEQGVQHMSPVAHLKDVRRAGIKTLAILDGVDKLVGELLGHPQQIGLDKVHHGVV